MLAFILNYAMLQPMTSNVRSLHTLWERGCTFLGSEVAIMGGAMSWVSERNLVSALSNAGAFGVIAASSMPPELLKSEIIATQARTTLPFGVNLILMHPQLDALIEVCRETGVTHVVLAGGIPKKPTIDSIHAFGAKVIAFAPTVMIAKKLIKMGADALVIEGNEAGGHIGPVSTNVLAQEILPAISEVPVFIAGELVAEKQLLIICAWARQAFSLAHALSARMNQSRTPILSAPSYSPLPEMLRFRCNIIRILLSFQCERLLTKPVKPLHAFKKKP